MTKQVGSVEILRLRVYPSEPERPDEALDVAVPPGIYPLYSDGHRFWWRMTGVISERHQPEFERLGDGLFALNPGGDVLSEEKLTISTRTWTPDEFAELRTEWGFQDGPEQRVRIKVFAEERAS